MLVGERSESHMRSSTAIAELLALMSVAAARVPAAKRLPQVHADDPQAALSLAVMRLRALPAWSADADVGRMCLQGPPFGIADAPERIHGALWSAEGANATLRGRNMSAAAGASENCANLARTLQRVTGRPRRSTFSTCAVVGSSGGLRGSQQGMEIDEHEAVFRFNTAPTGGRYAADVGNRTSLWVASHIPWRAQLKARVGAMGEEEAALYCFNHWLGKCFSDAVGGTMRDARGRPTMPLLMSPLLTGAMMAIQVALGGKSSGPVRPSTGLMGVGLALASCARVTIYGFANYTEDATRAFCNHYYDCRFNQSRYLSGKMGYHDWQGQWRVLAALVDLGALRYRAPTGPVDGSTATVSYVPAAPQPRATGSRVPRASRLARPTRRDAQHGAKQNSTVGGAAMARGRLHRSNHTAGGPPLLRGRRNASAGVSSRAGGRTSGVAHKALTRGRGVKE